MEIKIFSLTLTLYRYKNVLINDDDNQCGCVEVLRVVIDATPYYTNYIYYRVRNALCTYLLIFCTSRKKLIKYVEVKKK